MPAVCGLMTASAPYPASAGLGDVEVWLPSETLAVRMFVVLLTGALVIVVFVSYA